MADVQSRAHGFKEDKDCLRAVLFCQIAAPLWGFPVPLKTAVLRTTMVESNAGDTAQVAAQAGTINAMVDEMSELLKRDSE